MADTLMFGSAAQNEIIEASAKLSPHIGVPLDHARFHSMGERCGVNWDNAYQAGIWSVLINIRDGLHGTLGQKEATSALAPWRIFGFITDSASVNGMATRLFDPQAQAYYLGITAGCYIQPYLLHAKLAVLDSYFPEIEAFGPPVRVPLGTGDIVELSSGRHMLANTLAVVSTYAVFFHELAHIMRGHIAKINELDATEAPHILESNLSRQGEVDVQRRAMETDADFQAGIWLAEFFVKRRVRLPMLGPDVTESLPRIMMAVLVTFYQFGQSKKYHDGISRVFVILAGMLSQLPVGGDGVRGAAAFAVPMIEEFISTMNSAGVAVDNLDVDDLDTLLQGTEPEMQRIIVDLVGKRPERWSTKRPIKRSWWANWTS